MRRRQIVDHSVLEMALVGYQAQHAQLTAKMVEIRKKLVKAGANGGGGDVPTPFRKKRVLSAAALKRISAAQKKRWAAFHVKQNSSAATAKKPAPRKPMSGAVKAKRIAALARARAAKAAKARTAAA